MTNISLEELLFMQAVLSDQRLKSESGCAVVRSVALKGCLQFPFVIVGGEEWFATDCEKAAALAEVFSERVMLGLSLRIGVVLGCLLLAKNGYRIASSDEELHRAAMHVAMRQWTHKTLVHWYEQHCTQAADVSASGEINESP